MERRDVRWCDEELAAGYDALVRFPPPVASARRTEFVIRLDQPIPSECYG